MDVPVGLPVHNLPVALHHGALGMEAQLGRAGVRVDDAHLALHRAVTLVRNGLAGKPLRVTVGVLVRVGVLVGTGVPVGRTVRVGEALTWQCRQA